MLWLILVLLLAAPVSAEEYPFSVLFLSFRDIGNDAVITEMPVSMQFNNLDLGTKTSITRIIDRDGVSRYELRPGNWELESVLDKQRTSEADYYTKTLFLIDEGTFVSNLTVYVTPVGAVEGMVIDSANNRISGAALEFKCKSDEHGAYPTQTNQFGAFNVPIIPAGNCKVSAAYQGKVGTEEVKVVQGEMVEVTVNLDKRLVSQRSDLWYWVALALMLISGSMAWHILKLRRQTPKQKQAEKLIEAPIEPPTHEPATEQPKDDLNPRARDIMATLKDNEETVVKYLLANENASTQAKIRNGTGVPKTTLARAFLALEEKKVLNVEKIGKMKRVALTEWFLGKE